MWNLLMSGGSLLALLCACVRAVDRPEHLDPAVWDYIMTDDGVSLMQRDRERPELAKQARLPETRLAVLRFIQKDPLAIGQRSAVRALEYLMSRMTVEEAKWFRPFLFSPHDEVRARTYRCLLLLASRVAKNREAFAAIALDGIRDRSRRVQEVVMRLVDAEDEELGVGSLLEPALRTWQVQADEDIRKSSTYARARDILERLRTNDRKGKPGPDEKQEAQSPKL